MATSTLEDEIWDRLKSAKDLSKADIAFLLKCREENKRLKEKVAKVSDELDRIKLITEHVSENPCVKCGTENGSVKFSLKYDIQLQHIK